MKKISFHFFPVFFIAAVLAVSCSNVSGPGSGSGGGSSDSSSANKEPLYTADGQRAVEAWAEEDGIHFSLKIPASIYEKDGAGHIGIYRNGDGMSLEVSPENYEDMSDLVYPLVEAGKEYTFNINFELADHSDFDWRKNNCSETVTVTAKGGIGEIKMPRVLKKTKLTGYEGLLDGETKSETESEICFYFERPVLDTDFVYPEGVSAGDTGAAVIVGDDDHWDSYTQWIGGELTQYNESDNTKCCVSLGSYTLKDYKRYLPYANTKGNNDRVMIQWRNFLSGSGLENCGLKDWMISFTSEPAALRDLLPPEKDIGSLYTADGENAVTAWAEEDGIHFNLKLPASTAKLDGYIGISVELEENIQVETTPENRDKMSNLVYPLVEAGKEYTFNINFEPGNHTSLDWRKNILSDSVTVKATGGIGEIEMPPVLKNTEITGYRTSVLWGTEPEVSVYFKLPDLDYSVLAGVQLPDGVDDRIDTDAAVIVGDADHWDSYTQWIGGELTKLPDSEDSECCISLVHGTLDDYKKYLTYANTKGNSDRIMVQARMLFSGSALENCGLYDWMVTFMSEPADLKTFAPVMTGKTEHGELSAAGGGYAVEARAESDGIHFNLKVPANVNGEAGHIDVRRSLGDGIFLEADVDMGNMSELVYPLVNPGKEYTFTVNFEPADHSSDWRKYVCSDTVTVTAKGGIGEISLASSGSVKPWITEYMRYDEPSQVSVHFSNPAVRFVRLSKEVYEISSSGNAAAVIVGDADHWDSYTQWIGGYGWVYESAPGSSEDTGYVDLIGGTLDEYNKRLSDANALGNGNQIMVQRRWNFSIPQGSRGFSAYLATSDSDSVDFTTLKK